MVVMHQYTVDRPNISLYRQFSVGSFQCARLPNTITGLLDRTFYVCIVGTVPDQISPEGSSRVRPIIEFLRVQPGHFLHPATRIGCRSPRSGHRTAQTSYEWRTVLMYVRCMGGLDADVHLPRVPAVR